MRLRLFDCGLKNSVYLVPEERESKRELRNSRGIKCDELRSIQTRAIGRTIKVITGVKFTLYSVHGKLLPNVSKVRIRTCLVGERTFGEL